MRINLYEILSVVGKEKTEKVGLETSMLRLHGESLKISSGEDFSITCKQIQKNLVTVEGVLTVTVEHACSRCNTSLLSSPMEDLWERSCFR